MEEEVQQTPQEQYDTWKQNCALLYDRLVVNKLLLPSLAFTWLPQKIQTQYSIIYKYAYGTNSSGAQQNQFVYFGEMQIPKFKNINDQQKDIVAPTNTVYYQISHPGQPNRIIRHPGDYKQVATKTVEGIVNIYKDNQQYPIQLLTGHDDDGYGIDWKEQGIVSGAYDGKVLVWKDVYALNTTPTFSGKYQDKIEDTKWLDENVFLAVADDGFITTWDIRTKDTVARYKWATTQLNTIDVNNFQKQLVVVGTGSGVVQIWDLRCPNQQLYPFQNHSGSVIRVQWSPHSSNIFASASVDTQVNIWDMLKVGVQVSTYETQQIPSQLVFTHKGHRGPVSDLNWNIYQPLLGSVQQQFNTLQFYAIPSLLNQKHGADLDYQKKQILL